MLTRRLFATLGIIEISANETDQLVKIIAIKLLAFKSMLFCYDQICVIKAWPRTEMDDVICLSFYVKILLSSGI